MVYNLTRQKRKTVSISLNKSGEILVKAPLKTPLSKIEEFLYEKEHWIEKQKIKMAKVNEFKNKFDLNNYVYILGKSYKPEDINISFQKKGDKLFKQTLQQFYYNMAENKLPLMVEGNCHNLKYNSVKLTNSKRIWGSFDRNYKMKLNWRLIMLPEELIHYVIIHELCHGLELNHSKAFWLHVGEYCPNYKKLKKQLEMYSFLLEK